MTKKLLILIVGVGSILLLNACAPTLPLALVGSQPGFDQLGPASAMQAVDQPQPTPMQKNPDNSPGNMEYGSGGIDGNQGNMNQPYGRGPGWSGPGMHGKGQRGGWNSYDNCMGGYNNGFAPGQTLGSDIPPATSQDVSFRADVQPIFNSRCVSCHGGTEGIYLDNYPNVMNGSNSWPVILPGDPVNSRLIQLVSNKNMPYGGPPLSGAQIQILVDWVAAGAPNN